MITFEISKSELSSRIENLCKVVNAKNTLPVLDNLYFHLDGTFGLTITACDSEIHAITCIPMFSDTEATFGLDARKLQNILKEVPEQPLTFIVDVDRFVCTVKYSNGHFSLPVADVKEFPTVPNTVAVNGNIVIITPDVFHRILSSAPNFVGMDELRPIMSGICLDMDNEHQTITAAASDGHGLVRYIQNCSCEQDGRIILPVKAAKLAEAFAKKQEDNIIISYNPTLTYIHIKLQHYEIYTRVLEGRYPNYNSVIPMGNPHYVDVDRNELQSALRRVSVMADINMLVKFGMVDDHLTLETEDIDYSTGAKESILVDKSGDNCTIGLKGTLVQNVLSNSKAEKLRIQYRNAACAVVVTPVRDGEADWSELNLIMPMMLS